MEKLINHPLDVVSKNVSLDLSAVELPEAIHGDCSGTAGTAGTFGTAGGCFGSVGSFGSYGCGGGASDLGSLA